MNKPREYTLDEIKDKIALHVHRTARYWMKSDLKRPEFVECVTELASEEGITYEEAEVLWRLKGFGHTIGAMLDGCCVDIPGFLLIPNPHPDDKAYDKGEGENWWPAPKIKNDVGGEFRLFENRVRAIREKEKPSTSTLT